MADAESTCSGPMTQRLPQLEPDFISIGVTTAKNGYVPVLRTPFRGFVRVRGFFPGVALFYVPQPHTVSASGDTSNK